MFDLYAGARKKLDAIDIPAMSYRLDSGEDEMRAVMEVEARGRGFDSRGRLLILGEPHVFYRNLSGLERSRAVNAGLAYRSWGEKPYPSDSYPWLERAVKINLEAALASCSMGMSQVLGENAESLGYASPSAMWTAFMRDEEEHIEAMVRFILVNNIDDDMRRHDWKGFARVYNGPGYARNGYDRKLANAYAKWARVPDLAWAPDRAEITPTLTNEETARLQSKLHDAGYPEVGKADGWWGLNTRAAVLAARADMGLPYYAGVDHEFLDKLYGVDEEGASPEPAPVEGEGDDDDPEDSEAEKCMARISAIVNDYQNAKGI